MRFGQSFFVGVPVVFVVTSIAVGGVESAAAVVFMSIVCTAGVGLVFWIPVCTLAGWMTLSLVGLVVSKTSSDGGGPVAPSDSRDRSQAVDSKPTRGPISSPVAPPKNEVQVVADYITEFEEHGGSRERALELLRQNGWSGAEVSKALDLLEARMLLEHMQA